MSGDDLLARVLSGRPAERRNWDDYYRAFHADRPSATAENFLALRAGDGRTSYEVLAAELPEDCRAVLDVGCGDGVLLDAVTRRLPRARLSGIDLCESDVELAKRRLSNAPVEVLEVANALDLPFHDGAFDCVISHMVLMLIPEVETALREMHRVLHKNGTVAFIVGDPGSSPKHMRDLFASVNDAIRRKHEKFTPLNPADVRIFETNGVESLVIRAGFERVRQRQFTVRTTVDGGLLYERLMRRYYLGSLPAEERSTIKNVAESFALSSFDYVEPLRLVVASR